MITLLAAVAFFLFVLPIAAVLCVLLLERQDWDLGDE